jgi:hypothetical protein
MTHENIVKYWASGPDWTPAPAPEGRIVLYLNRPPFHDLESLSPAEKDLLRPALAANPSWLYAIPMHRKIQ